MKDYIMVQSERGGVTVESTSSAPPEGSTATIGSTNVSSVVGIAPNQR